MDLEITLPYRYNRFQKGAMLRCVTLRYITWRDVTWRDVTLRCVGCVVPRYVTSYVMQVAPMYAILHFHEKCLTQRAVVGMQTFNFRESRTTQSILTKTGKKPLKMIQNSHVFTRDSSRIWRVFLCRVCPKDNYFILSGYHTMWVYRLLVPDCSFVSWGLCIIT